jgi:membrane protein
MALRRAVILLYRTLKGFSDRGDGQMAASISYYVLLSIFPLLILSVGILGIFLRDAALQQDLVDAVLDNIPLSQDEGRTDVTEALRDVAGDSGRAVGVLGFLTMAWTSSSMFGTIRRSLIIVFDVESPPPLLPRKAVDLLMVLLFAPFFVASIAATTALRLAQQASGDVPLLGSVPQVMGAGWLLVSLLLPMVVSFIAFFGLYWLVPSRGDRWRHLATGALFGALLFELIKLGFSIYLENFSNYDVVFGSLGAVIAFLVWVFLSANALLLGAEMAAIAPRVLAGEFDYDLGGRPGAPRRSLAQKAAALLLSTVVRPKRPQPPAPTKEQDEPRRASTPPASS